MCKPQERKCQKPSKCREKIQRLRKRKYQKLNKSREIKYTHLER